MWWFWPFKSKAPAGALVAKLQIRDEPSHVFIVSNVGSMEAALDAILASSDGPQVGNVKTFRCAHLYIMQVGTNLFEARYVWEPYPRHDRMAFNAIVDSN